MIGQLLCALGFHRWSHRDRVTVEGETLTVMTLSRCSRCDIPEHVVNIERVVR